MRDLVSISSFKAVSNIAQAASLAQFLGLRSTKKKKKTVGLRVNNKKKKTLGLRALNKKKKKIPGLRVMKKKKEKKRFEGHTADYKGMFGPVISKDIRRKNPVSRVIAFRMGPRGKYESDENRATLAMPLVAVQSA